MVTSATAIRANGASRLMNKFLLSGFLDTTICGPYPIKRHRLFKTRPDLERASLCRNRRIRTNASATRNERLLSPGYRGCGSAFKRDTNGYHLKCGNKLL